MIGKMIGNDRGFDQATRDQAGYDREAAELLVSELRKAWQRGWQPLDLHRLVSQDLTKRHLPVLCSAIADEMHCYAAETVDPRWRDQLAELGALPGGDARPDRLERMPLHRTNRVDWLRQVTEITRLVRFLVPVQVLLPPPGRGVAGSRSTAQEVDDKVLRRVRALLAKAESTQYPEEAESYTAAAQRMMTRHRIDAAMLQAASGEGRREAHGRRIGIDAPYESAKVAMLGAVGEANGCRTVWSKGLGFCTVVGAETDVDLVEGLFTSLLLQAATAVQRAGAGSGSGSRSRSRAFKRSFLTAYAVRIGERLSEATAGEVDAAAARAGGSQLVPMLAERSRQADTAVESLFGRVRNTSISSALDPAGWASGLGAADQARLGTETGAAVSG